MKKMAMALSLGLLVGTNAQAEMMTQQAQVLELEKMTIEAQKEMLELEGYAISKTRCTGKTAGGTYPNGTTYKPKFVTFDYCTLGKDVDPVGKEGIQEATVFQCEYGTSDRGPEFEKVARVQINELVYNAEYPHGGPGVKMGFTQFVTSDVRENFFNEEGVAFVGSNDGDMTVILNDPNLDYENVNPDDKVLRVEGVAGEDDNKFQQMRSSLECLPMWQKNIPKVETTSITGALMVHEDPRGKSYYVKSEKGDIYLDTNGNSDMVKQITDELNQGEDFTFEGKVVGSDAQGYEMVLEKLTYAVPAEQPKVH